VRRDPEFPVRMGIDAVVGAGEAVQR